MIHHNTGDIGSLHADHSRRTSNNNTNNYIYLHPGPNQDEFDSWMRKIGSLLQISSSQATLKPFLDLIIATMEPERIFIRNYALAEKSDIDGCTEIMVVTDVEYSTEAIYLFLKLAFISRNNIVLSFHNSNDVNDGLVNGHPYYSFHCKEDYLVFSGSPYRLPQTSVQQLSELSAKANEVFKADLDKSASFVEVARIHHKNNQFNIAALMLHQACEQHYKSIVLAFGGNTKDTHSLFELEKIALLYIPQIFRVFSNEDKVYLQLLDSAYSSQTDSSFKVNEEYAVILFQKVETLLKLSKEAFEAKLLITDVGVSIAE
jgi:hypothetical protein